MPQLDITHKLEPMELILNHYFIIGYHHGHGRKPYPPEYDNDPKFERIFYEQGRQFSALCHLSLTHGGYINMQAVKALTEANLMGDLLT